MEDETLDISAAAKFLGVRASTIRAWCSQKRLRFFKAGRCVRFRRSWLEEFIAQNSEQPEIKTPPIR
jgi:excisionase family DNA binding protein